MTPAPYPKPSHDSVICTFADCPNRKEWNGVLVADSCYHNNSLTAKLLQCHEIVDRGLCFQGFTR
jgi:hypothetical protein